MKKQILFYLLLGVSIWTMQSCMSAKKGIYAYNIEEAKDSARVASFSSDHKLQVSDLVVVTVLGITPEAVQEFNMMMQGGGGNLAGAGGRGIGQRVSKEGNIIVPRVGEVQVLGLTIEEASERIRQEVAKLVVSPTVYVSLLNYKVSVIGAVRSPGSYTPMTDRITILEALAQAGDMQFTGLRDRVWVIREENGQRRYNKINLNDKDLFASDYYYLKNNDLVYVQPNGMSSFIGGNGPLFTLIGATTGIIALALTIFR
jgi:polysaccharide export outer membrane protein